MQSVSYKVTTSAEYLRRTNADLVVDQDLVLLVEINDQTYYFYAETYDQTKLISSVNVMQNSHTRKANAATGRVTRQGLYCLRE
jgi:hypothetical protein